MLNVYTSIPQYRVRLNSCTYPQLEVLTVPSCLGELNSNQLLCKNSILVLTLGGVYRVRGPNFIRSKQLSTPKENGPRKLQTVQTV